MKTENIKNNITTHGNRPYIKPHAYIIKMETNYGIMEDKSIPEDPYTPAEGDGNAKQFDMTEDMWNDYHEKDIDIFN